MVCFYSGNSIYTGCINIVHVCFLYFQEDDVSNINITSNSVEDKSDGQSKVAEAQPTQSCDQLPKKRSIIISPQSRNSQSYRASHRISDHFGSEGNSIGHCEVECSVMDKAARGLRDSAFSTAAEYESAKVRERTARSSAICMCSVLHSNKETSVQNFSPPCGQNSKTYVQNCKTQMDVPEHCSRVDIDMQSASSVSSLMYDARPLVTFPDSVVKEWSTNDVKDLEMANSLEGEEKNETQSENEVVRSEGQNESVHMDVRTNGEHVNYPSVQAFLKILESDDDSISFESDIENSQVGKMLAYSICRPPTPGPAGRRKSSSTECNRAPTTACVKVEKLSEKKKETVLKVCSTVKLKPIAKQTRKLQRGSSKKQKIQSNQYR
jgi:hypothetical protein